MTSSTDVCDEFIGVILHTLPRTMVLIVWTVTVMPITIK
jgi:hypothetical protein